MRLLLDTHVILWAADQPELLSPRVRQELESADRPLVSVASIWEMIVKIQKGTLELPAPERTIRQMIDDLGAELVPVRLEHALALLSLEPHHKDPFDRMLVAQAKVESAAIATIDNLIARYPVNIVW